MISLSRRSNKKFGTAQGDFGGGQTVEIVGLQGRKDLNGQFGLTARFVPTPGVSTTSPGVAGGGRWEVLLPNGEGVRVKPINLQSVQRAPQSIGPLTSTSSMSTIGGSEVGPGAGRVLVFWGVARWTRAQLLGEIARGHWYILDRCFVVYFFK